jgi:hypothetical protein
MEGGLLFMNALFELLFENPFFIIIVIGLISSLFKRIKGSIETPPDQRETKQKSPEISLEDYFPVKPERRPDIEKETKKIVPSVKENVSNLQETYSELKKQQDVWNEKLVEIRDMANQIQALKSPSKQSASVVFKLDPNKVVEGVILSEILGPPRAKRGFRK